MKTIYIKGILLLLISTLVIGCSDSDEVPPRVESIPNQYILPKAQPISATDRQEVIDRQTEYEASL